MWLNFANRDLRMIKRLMKKGGLTSKIIFFYKYWCFEYKQRQNRDVHCLKI